MKKAFIIISLIAVSTFILNSCQNTAKGENNETVTDEAPANIPAGSIVFFDVDKILEQYDMANDLRSEVETKVAAIQKDIERRQTNLQNKANDFQNQYSKGLMTSAVAAAKQQELQQQGASFQEYAQKKEAEIMEEQQVMMNRIADAIKTYVDKYNEEKQFALIISNQANMPIISGDAKLNITDEIIAGLNEEYVKAKKAE